MRCCSISSLTSAALLIAIYSGWLPNIA